MLRAAPGCVRPCGMLAAGILGCHTAKVVQGLEDTASKAEPILRQVAEGESEPSVPCGVQHEAEPEVVH